MCSVMSSSFETPWTLALQVPPSMGFSRQEYWSGSHFPLQATFPTQGWQLRLMCLLDCQADSLRLITREAYTLHRYNKGHRSTTACRGCTRLTMYNRQVNYLTWLDMVMHVHIFQSSQFEGSYVRDLLY